MSLDVLMLNRYFASNLNPAGYYAQASFLASLPFVLFNALYATIFPNIVHEISRGAVEKAREIVVFSTRVIAVSLIPICVIVWGSAGEILRFFNPPQYAAAALSFSVLIVSISLYTLFMNLGVITVAGGHPKKFTSSFLFLLPLGVILNLLIVPYFAKHGVQWRYGDEYLLRLDFKGSEVLVSEAWALTGAAIAAGMTALVGCVYLGLHVQRRFKGIFDLKVAFRALSAAIPTYLFVYFVKLDGAWILVELAIAPVIYVISIILTGEFDKEELKMAFNRFRRK
jgi:Na+-driven multidrug efflux pump